MRQTVHIEPEISVLNLDPALIPSCILAMSSGTVLATHASTTASPYRPNSYIPRPPWVNLSAHACGWSQTRQRAGGPVVGMVQVCASVAAPLCRKVSSLRPGASLEPSDIAALFEHLALRLGAREPVAHNGGKWDPPGLETVTVDPHRSDYLGLHLDSWEGRSYAARKTARTRVCVNLGPQKRWFLFVGLSLPTIAEAIRAKRNDEFLLEPNELVHAFFREFPDFPVSRLAVDPGQAYFADTDNLIHDGSSFGAAGWTFHYTIRGHFDRLSRA